MKFTILFLSPATLLLASVALGGFDSGSDGSDGVLAPAGAEHYIDLSQAMTATWDTPNTDNPGAGVYDPDLWIVVFKYQSVLIPQNVTVHFLNHPSGAPVVWLVEDSVNISGTVDISGDDYIDCNDVPYKYSTPGPGGFAGGAGTAVSADDFPSSSGFGPGGSSPGAPGNGGFLAFENSPYLSPLIGGSGGGGCNYNNTSYNEYGGGAGGGALLVAASNNIVFGPVGVINARGGSANLANTSTESGPGSGGAVRLLASTISGSVDVEVQHGTNGTGGGDGHVRVEAFDISGAVFTEVYPSGNISFGSPGLPIPPSNRPRLRVISCGGMAVPADPSAVITSPDIVVDTLAVTVVIEAENIPLNASVQIQVRPAHGDWYQFAANGLQDDDQDGVATSTTLITLPELHPASIQATASW